MNIEGFDGLNVVRKYLANYYLEERIVEAFSSFREFLQDISTDVYPNFQWSEILLSHSEMLEELDEAIEIAYYVKKYR